MQNEQGCDCGGSITYAGKGGPHKGVVLSTREPGSRGPRLWGRCSKW